MKKDYTKYLAAAVGVVVTTAIVAGATYAYQGDPNKKGPNFSPERHEAMIQAIDSQDYDAWKELMGNNSVVEKITAENFTKFVEARQLMVDGRYEEAKALRTELGLQNKQGLKNNWNRMHKNEKVNKEEFTAIKEAVINKDYEAWKNAWQELKGDYPMDDKLTEEKFAQAVEIHNLMQAGEYEEVKKIKAEIGKNWQGKFRK